MTSRKATQLAKDGRTLMLSSNRGEEDEDTAMHVQVAGHAGL